MNEDTVKGTAEQAGGKIKEGVGKLTHNENQQVEGQADQAKSSAHKVVGKVKDAACDVADSLKAKDS